MMQISVIFFVSAIYLTHLLYDYVQTEHSKEIPMPFPRAVRGDVIHLYPSASGTVGFFFYRFNQTEPLVARVGSSWQSHCF